MRSNRAFQNRLRALIVAATFAFATFAVSITPIATPITGPLGLAPKTAQAAYCASNAAFTGRLTASSASTTAVSRITNGTVFGYISNVDAAWSCTLYYRYSGIAYNTSATLGTFDYGALIHSTTVSCNWVVGSTDYLKANDTADCPDFDAEYAMSVTLGAEGSYTSSTAHTATGQFSFVHSDCATTTFYGTSGKVHDTGQTFSTAITGNRPGANCDPLAIDSTGTTQTVTYDHTAPTLDFTTPNEATTTYRNTIATYTVTTAITETVAGFGGTNLWRLQRQIATISSPGTCGTFANDTATGNLTTGTTTGTINTSQTLVAARCYRWLLNATDQNGNVAATDTSGTVLVDTVAPTTDFGAPNEGTTTTQGLTTFSVSWIETDADSGVNTRSLQRQKVAVAAGVCGTTWANDGTAVTTVSPLSVTGLVTATCYRWNQTLTDRATNATTKTSGTVLVDTSNPTVDFTTPNEGSNTIQGGTSYVVAWTETTGGATVTARSLQRQKATITTSGSCAGLTFANDGSAVTTASPVTSSSLLGGTCYRWVETVTVNTGKQGSSTSGTVLVDTTNPAGSISAPVGFGSLAGTVTITGTATDAHSFKNYVLDYGVGAAPSSWTTLTTATNQVTAGTLYSWTTSSVAAGAYTLRLTVNDNAAHATSATVLVFVDNTRRGDESYWTSVPFDLGGGYTLGIGVANGEATVDRDLFSIPSYGPPQALALTYSSAETTSRGRFGVGWSSNLTQYLTFESGFNVWHRADGGRVPFGQIASVWTPLHGHFETMSVDGVAHEVTITQKDQTKLVFQDSGNGRLLRIVNRFGKALTLVWNTTSATATDASGRVTNITIDSSNDRIIGATDSAGRAWSFGYAGTGSISDLTTITDPASKVTTLVYANHQLTDVKRNRIPSVGGTAVEVKWTVAYTAGKATSVTDPVSAGVANTFTYNAGSTDVALLKEVGGPVRNTSTYAFDALGRVTSATDPEGFITTSVFDADSNVLSVANPIGTGTATVSTTSTYDSRGNLLTEIVPIDASTTVTTVNSYSATNDLVTRSEADNDPAVKLVTKYTYADAIHLTAVDVDCTTTGTTPPTLASGCTGAGTQDAATNLITNYAYTTNDQLAYEQDPLGRVTKHVYDTYGNETSTIANCTSTGTSTPSPFDSCSAGGTIDAQTNVVSGATFDLAVTAGKAGLATATTDPLGRDTTLTFDALGRKLTEVLPGDGASIPVLTRTTAYDEFGNVLTSAEDWLPVGGGSAVNRTTTTVYDFDNRDTTSTDLTGATTTNGYDAAGNAVSTTSGGVTTAREFDGLGRVLTETTDTGSASHAYDAQGYEILTASAEGEVTATTFTYTGWSLTETTDPGGLALTMNHAYDTLGHEAKATSPTGTVTRSGYDRAGRTCRTVPASTQTDAAWAGQNVCTDPIPDGATATVYDRAGNAVAVKTPDGAVAATFVDPLDRTIKSIGNCTNTGTTQPAAGVTCAGTGIADSTTNMKTLTYYDASGATVAVQDPKGITVRTIPNVRGLASQTIANCTDSGTTPTTNPPACTGVPPATEDATTNVKTTTTYDGTGAATGNVIAVGTGAEATTETAYDAAGRAQAVKDPMGTIKRSFFDPLTGQLTRTVVNCTTSGTTIPTDWANCTGAGTSDGTWNLATTYAYDALGNQTSVIAPNLRRAMLVYDQANRLLQRIDNYVDGDGTTQPTTPILDDLVTTYFYDQAGRTAAVVAPTVDGATFSVTRSTYNPDGTLATEIRNCTNTGISLDLTTEDPGTCTGAGTANADTNIVTAHGYDTKGNRISMTAPDPSATSGTSTAPVTTQYAYDIANRLCRVVENATGGTNLQTLADPCSTATQGSGTTTANVSTRYTYDAAGNLATTLDGAGHTTSYGYDAAGRQTSLLDADGKTLVWAYDGLGNKIRQENRVDPPLTASVTWTYDGAGRVLTRQADGVTTSYVYDANGNKLTASDGTFTITSSFDRLNRVLTVDDEDPGSGTDTTYSYSLTSPSWTDPTGTYGVTLDPFNRATVINDPVNATNFTTAYRADGQPASIAAPNGNTTAYGYDHVGQLTSKHTTAGLTDRAIYDWTYNRAGQILTENSQITGDTTNGTRTTAYDPLGRLTGSTIGGATTAYGWDKVPNRTSVQVGAGTPATTTYTAANRPTSGTNPTAAYLNDGDGDLTARPAERFEWDHLGRLTKVRPATGGGTIATYTYDPLDRLRMADYGGSNQVRFRYVGLTTSVAQTIDDHSGSVIRNFGTGWGGERLFDWTGAGSNLRFYGENVHHDVTWTASSTGSVSATLRYDPWGTLTASTGTSLPDHRFQGSWYDTATDLSWVVARWYAPTLGRFISEDSLLGELTDPPSRHLYAYGEGEPVAHVDLNGQTSYKSYYFNGLVHFRGTLLLSLFIAAHYNYTSIPFGTMRFLGDNRSWGPRCDQSRGCIWVKFGYHKVMARVNNTCTAVNFLWSDWIDLGCAGAFPIVPNPLPYTCLRPPSGSCGYPQQYNLVKVIQTGGTIKVVWDITQAGAPIVRPGLTVNGSMTIRPAACCVYAPTIEYHGEGFPSEELYWYSPLGGRRTVFQHPEGRWQAMAPGEGDWSRTYALPQR